MRRLGIPAVAARRRYRGPGARPLGCRCVARPARRGRRSSPRSARTTPHRRWSACRPTTPGSPTSPAAPGRSSASSSTDPVLTEASRQANFTNEGGVDGRIRFLRNVMGLWLLQESLRTWGRRRRPTRAAARPRRRELPAGGPVIDVDDPAFLPAGRHAGPDRRRLPRHRAAAAQRTGRHGPLHPRQPRRGVRPHGRDAAAAPGTRSTSSTWSVAVARTRCSASSRPTRPGLPVLAGPVEATALGNVAGPGPRARRLSAATCRPAALHARDPPLGGPRAAGPSWTVTTSADRAVRHLPGRRDVPVGGPGDRVGCSSGWATRSCSRPGRPAAARCTSTPATRRRRCRWCDSHVDVFDAVRRGRRPEPARASARSGTSTRCCAERVGDPALADACRRWPPGPSSCPSCWSTCWVSTDVGARYPAPGDLPPDLPLAADARVGDQPLRLLRAVDGLELVELPAADSAAASAAPSR